MTRKTRKPARARSKAPSVPARLRRDEVAAVLRREIARQNALERSCEPLALIAETAIVYSEGGVAPGYTIVDATGSPRTRTLRGKIVPFTIADLVAELRRDHRNLFGPAPARIAGSGLLPDALLGQGDETDHLPVAALLRVAPRAAFPADSDAFPATPPFVAAAPHFGPIAVSQDDSLRACPPSLSGPGLSAPEPPRSRDWIRLGEPASSRAPEPQVTPTSARDEPPPAGAATALGVTGPAVVALDPMQRQSSPPPSAAIAAQPPRAAARRYREPVAIRPDAAVPKPRLAGGWRPPRLLMRVLYVAAFVGGMAAYNAVRHLS